jgi:4-carboxymuconolactone decarboxylase
MPAFAGMTIFLSEHSRQSTTEEDEMAESELYRKGAALRRQLYGDAAVDRANRETYNDPVMKKFIDVATETVFGALWTRPGLDLKTRTLICVVSDAATAREPELAIHLRFALRQGWTEDELTEVLVHLSGYVGVPIIREAMLVAKRTFAEIRAEQGKA